VSQFPVIKLLVDLLDNIKAKKREFDNHLKPKLMQKPKQNLQNIVDSIGFIGDMILLKSRYRSLLKKLSLSTIEFFPELTPMNQILSDIRDDFDAQSKLMYLLIDTKWSRELFNIGLSLRKYEETLYQGWNKFFPMTDFTTVTILQLSQVDLTTLEKANYVSFQDIYQTTILTLLRKDDSEEDYWNNKIDWLQENVNIDVDLKKYELFPLNNPKFSCFINTVYQLL
jgi:hypothetical protein